MSLDDSVEAVRAAVIKRMGRKEYLLPAGLIQVIANESGQPELTVRQALGRLRREGWIAGVADDGTPFGRIRITGPVPMPEQCPHSATWRRAIADAGLSSEELATLEPLGSRLAGCDVAVMEQVVRGLRRLRSQLALEAGRHRFLVSAEYLVGSSKMLDTLGGPALRAFGVDINLFPRHPRYVVSAGAADPEAVILVENPAAFELAATTTAVRRCAFIATFGFGLSKAAEEYGNQLAGMVEDRFSHAITLVREGSSAPPVKKLLSNPNITFWGDLDMAGMEIYERIARCVPAIQLSALYGPMIEAVAVDDQRHPYVAAVGKSGQAIFQASRDDALNMLSYCREWAVDQEMVPVEQIEKLAGRVLELED